MYRVTRIPVGPVVATAEMPQVSSVSVGIWVGIGSRYESVSESGTCHFIEHLLFKGTKRRSAREISEAVEGRGGYLNAWTGEESTCFHARASATHFEEVLEVLMDMLVNSRFAPADIAREREVIKDEIAMYLDQPQHQVQEDLNSILWPNQPLGRPITGTERTLQQLNRPQLLDFLGRHYVAENTLLVVAGRITHAEVVRRFSRHVKRLERGPRPRFAPVRQTEPGPRIHLSRKKTEQTQLALGIRTCSRHDERRYALRLLNAVLGENMSSRLFQAIREDRGLVYSIYSSPSFFDDTGDLVISAGMETNQLPRVLRLVVKELKRLATQPMHAAELKRARDFALGQMDLSLESAENQMNWLGEQWLGYGRLFQPRAVKRRLAAVTAGEIRDVARGFFRPDRLYLSLVSPARNVSDLTRILANA